VSTATLKKPMGTARTEETPGLAELSNAEIAAVVHPDLTE